MEGPYRELGHGFARLSGREGARRAPSRITCVEDALFELLRNSRDAGARNVYVASTLRRRRYRVLTVIDDGDGVPGPYAERIFEPGVTTRHLRPSPSHADEPPHGAGLSLYHLKELAESAELLSASNPTSIKVAFDTTKLPETSLQSGARPSRSNISATLASFAALPDAPTIYHASPSRILATLIENHIILSSGSERAKPVGRDNDNGASIAVSEAREQARDLGLQVSGRTLQRILRGGVRSTNRVEESGTTERDGEVVPRGGQEVEVEGPELVLTAEELGALDQIIQRAARSRYLEASQVTENAQIQRTGKLAIEVTLHSPEDEYE